MKSLETCSLLAEHLQLIKMTALDARREKKEGKKKGEYLAVEENFIAPICSLLCLLNTPFTSNLTILPLA